MSLFNLKKSAITLGLVFLFIISITANDFNSLTEEDTIVLEISNKYGLFYRHIFKPKQTLYSIARLFGSNVQEVYTFNPALKNQSIQIGESVIIPVRTKMIITHKEDLDPDAEYLPVFYKVRARENLFRIARQYFFQPIQTLMKRNNLDSYDLDYGQILHVGWLRLGSDEPFIRREESRDSINLLMKNNLLKSNGGEDEKPEYNMVVRRGTAVWDKTSEDQENLFVLHPDARINSMIELYNPMLDRRVYARVIGKMPRHIYPKDVTILVSPKVAELLGIKDTRFLIEMRYIE